MSLHPYDSVTTKGITDHDSVVEVARLANKTQLLLQSLGGLFPGLSSERLRHVTTALEIACGPGGWTRELARAYPHIHITGIDTSPAMIAFARSMMRNPAEATLSYLEVPSFLGPYPFNEASFDLISIQLVSKFLAVDDWPHFLSTCWRLLRPGGLLRLTEFEVGLANAPIHEHLNQLFIHAMRLAHRSFSPSDRHLGVLCELEPLLHAGGFQTFLSVPHLINYSYGAPLYEEWKKDFLILFREVLPLIVQEGLATQEQVEELHQRQAYEMNLPTFHALLPMLTIWATKP